MAASAEVFLSDIVVSKQQEHLERERRFGERDLETRSGKQVAQGLIAKVVQVRGWRDPPLLQLVGLLSAHLESVEVIRNLDNQDTPWLEDAEMNFAHRGYGISKM